MRNQRSSSSALHRLLNVFTYVMPLKSHPSTKKQEKQVDERAGGLAASGSGQPALGHRALGPSATRQLRCRREPARGSTPAVGHGTRGPPGGDTGALR